MNKDLTIEEQTTAYIKKYIIVPLLLDDVAFLEYVAKEKGRAQLINKILGDEVLGSLHTLPLRGDVVLEMDVTSNSISLYERKLDSYYYKSAPKRNLLLTCAITTNDELISMRKQVTDCYKSYGYNGAELLTTFKDSIFEKVINNIVDNLLFRKNLKAIILRRYSFVENGLLLEIASGVISFRFKINRQGDYYPSLYRYEISRMSYLKNIDSMGHHKDLATLAGIYDHHSKEKYIINKRKSNNDVDDKSLMFIETDVLPT